VHIKHSDQTSLANYFAN